MLSDRQRIHSFKAPRHHRGSSLIEVLISVLLISLGIMAVAGMQAYSLAAQRNANNRAIASAMSNELAELIRLNPAGLNAGNYNVAFMSTQAPGPPVLATCVGATTNAAEYPFCNPGGVTGAGAALAFFDITSFQQRVRAGLPIGGVEVVANIVAAPARSSADIWISWQEPAVLIGALELNADNCTAASRALATQPRCFYMRVQL